MILQHIVEGVSSQTTDQNNSEADSHNYYYYFLFERPTTVRYRLTHFFIDVRRTKNKVLIVRDKTIQKLVSCDIQIQKLEIHEDFHTGTRFSPSLQQQKIQKLVSHYL